MNALPKRHCNPQPDLSLEFLYVSAMKSSEMHKCSEGKVTRGVHGHLDRNTQFSVVVPATLNTLPPSYCSCSVTEEIL